MTNALLKCTKCSDIFRNRHDLNNHVKNDHQSSVKVKFQNGGVTKVKRAEDNMFKCKCGKSFKLANSLRRHAKKCNDELSESEENEEERILMNMDDSDASESMNIDNRIVSADCFGALIFYEKC